MAVTIPLAAPTPGAHVFWSNAGGGFDDVGGTASGTSVTAFVSHFSVGFCALPAADAGAGDAPTDATTTGAGGQGGTAGTGGAGGQGGGAGTGGGGDAGTAADAAASDAASNLCAGTPLNLPAAKVTNVEAGAAPAGSTYTGGTITSGKHYLTAVSHYGGGSYTYVGMTFTSLDAHTLQANVVCNTGATIATAPRYYYTFGPSGSGSALTLTEVGSSDVLTIGPP